MNKSWPNFDLLQKISMSIMVVLVFITFIASNLHAVLWQSSDWLVSTVLPAVVVDLTNEERADNKIEPLRRNPTLDAAAKLKAEHMAKNEYFSHFSPDGVSPWYWFDKSGYVYAHAGENLAIHFTDSDEVVDAWMNSPAHRQNIIDKKYTEIGVATVKGKFEGYDTVYVVQLFGTPAVAPVAATKPTQNNSLAQADIETEVESVPVAVEKTALALKIETNTVPNELATETEVVDLPVETELAAEIEADPVPETPIETSSVIAVEDEVTVIESSTIATSSGLAVANITTETTEVDNSSLAGLATKPNTVLQIIYTVLAAMVVVLLLSSIVFEARSLHFAQASYGTFLLIVMGGLWYFHSVLTSGAVIV